MRNHFFFERALFKAVGYTDLFHFGEFSTLLNILRHKLTIRYIKKYFLQAFYQMKKNNYKNQKFNNIIWFFWWQGPKHMPITVHECFHSLIKNSNGCRVIYLDKFNVKKYARLPGYIYNKTMHGNITFTEFSDILRCNLLKNYGGIWSDASNFITDKMNISYFERNKLLITSGVSRAYHYYICTKWAVGLIGGYSNNQLFIFMNAFFLYYWRNNDYLISYNLIDYALYFAYIYNIGNFEYYVDTKTPYNNPKMFDLVKYMNYKYNPNIFNSLKNNTHVFNITYKKKYVDNRDTFYHKFITNRL